MAGSSRDLWTEKYGTDRPGSMRPVIKAPNKYRNKKCEYGGKWFDSIKEMNRYIELKAQEKAGEISNLECQVNFDLIPKCGKERKAFYIADFVYKQNGKMVVEDTKGIKTPAYILKRKILLWRFGIEIKEI